MRLFEPYESFGYMVRKNYAKVYTRIAGSFLRKKVEKAAFPYALNKTPRHDMPEVLVSIATYPARFDMMELCLKSVAMQDVKADRIMVWLGCDTTEEMYEKYLKKYEAFGVEFYIDSEHNYKSYKKVIYPFTMYPDALTITLDDDLIYPLDTISGLLKAYHKHPDCIVGRRSQYMRFDREEVMPYTKWGYETLHDCNRPTHRTFLTTGAGTLFPPYILPKEILDYDLICRYAPTADDVWINMMAIYYDVKRMRTGQLFLMPPEISRNASVRLASINVEQDMNTKYVRRIMKDYQITAKKILCEDK